MFLELLLKLRNCKHKNTSACDFVRNDGLLEDIVNSDDFKRRKNIQDHLSSMRYCVDCGSTQRYKLQDPIKSSEPWLAPWIWRKQ